MSLIFAVAAVIIFFGAFSVFSRHRSLMNHVMDQQRRAVDDSKKSPRRFSGDLGCSKCGAALDSDTEISPSGDFKCQYCDSWCNVNG